MKVSIKPASPMEVKDVEVKGTEMDIKPLFFQPKGKANLGVVEVRRDDGNIAFLGMLVVSGKDGVVSVIPRTKPVSAALDTGSRSKKSS